MNITTHRRANRQRRLQTCSAGQPPCSSNSQFKQVPTQALTSYEGMKYNVMEQMLWYQNAIFYQVYVRAFFDSNNDGHGDIQGLKQKLDYLQDLGVDCIWIMPIYPSPLNDDGYD